MRIKKLQSFLLLLLNLLLGHAQVHHTIKEVIIEEKGDASAFQQQIDAGPSSMIISGKDLNNLGHKTAGDVLRRMPRMILQGPPSFNRNIMMAGLNKEFQAVLINGNRPAGGEDSRDFKLDRLPLSMIDKIEITYTPPVDAGADAAIGIVNIILKDTPDKKMINAFCNIDHTTTNAGVHPEMGISYGNKWNKWSVHGGYNVTSFNRQNSNDIYDTVNKGNAHENIHVDIHGLTSTVVFRPDTVQKWKLQSLFTHYYETLDYLADIKRRSKGGLNLANDSATDSKYRTLHSHTISYQRSPLNYNWNTQLTLAQHFDKKDRWRIQEKSTGNEITFEDEDQMNREFMLKSSINYSAQDIPAITKINHGVRISYLNRDYDRFAFTKLENHSFWDNIEDGSYALKEYRLSAHTGIESQIHNLWLYPAIRLDKDMNSYSTASDTGWTDYFNINPSFHIKYTLTKNQFIKADIARQISRPPFNQTVPIDKVKNKKELIERGNPNLIPSRAWILSMGLENYFRRRNYLICRGFYTILRDIVEKQAAGIDELYGYRIYQAVNVDSGKVWGIEVSTRLEIWHIHHSNVQLWGNVSRLGSGVRDPGTRELRSLNEQPRWILNSSLDYLNTKARVKCSFGINYIGNRFIASTISDGEQVEELRQASFLQCDARIKFYPANWGSIYVNVVNLFDEHLDFIQGAVHESETIGRNFIVGMNVNF